MTHRFARPLFLALAAGALLTAPAAAQLTPPDAPAEPPVSVGASTRPASNAEARPQAGGEPLVGTFHITEGTCTAEGADGSYFRMTQPAGQPIDNGDSPCDDQSYTPLAPGTDGGLVTGGYQPHPDPAFDGDGNGVNDKITEPTAFYGVDFSTATNPTDPQTDTDVIAPEVVAASDGSLSGDLRAFAAAWNGQHFNQGSPKPDGEKPEGTEGPDGSYDSATGAFELEWSSRISGGPFNNFIGTWHLEGTFRSSQSGSQPSGGDASASSNTTAQPAASAASGGAAGASASAQTDSATSTGAHPRTGPATGTSAAGVALLAGFAVARALNRRAAEVTET